MSDKKQSGTKGKKRRRLTKPSETQEDDQDGRTYESPLKVRGTLDDVLRATMEDDSSKGGG